MNQTGEGYITEWHRVSSGAIDSWGGDERARNQERVECSDPANRDAEACRIIMPWAVWVRGDIAFHASNEAHGYPASKG